MKQDKETKIMYQIDKAQSKERCFRLGFLSGRKENLFGFFLESDWDLIIFYGIQLPMLFYYHESHIPSNPVSISSLLASMQKTSLALTNQFQLCLHQKSYFLINTFPEEHMWKRTITMYKSITAIFFPLFFYSVKISLVVNKRVLIY